MDILFLDDSTTTLNSEQHDNVGYITSNKHYHSSNLSNLDVSSKITVEGNLLLFNMKDIDRITPLIEQANTVLTKRIFNENQKNKYTYMLGWESISFPKSSINYNKLVSVNRMESFVDAVTNEIVKKYHRHNINKMRSQRLRKHNV